MATSSVQQYVGQVSRLLKELHEQDPSYINPAASLQSHWAVMAVKRKLGDERQRARPITLDEVRKACREVQGSSENQAAFRFILLLAWQGAFRLGQLLPSSDDQHQHCMEWEDIVVDGDSLLVTARRSKTNLLRAKTRTIRVHAALESSLCIVRAYHTLQRLRASRIWLNKTKLANLCSTMDTFAKFVAQLQRSIPPKPDTPLEKGTISGHSCRRGFTKAALAAGIPLERIMIHGDWSHADSVLDSYAVGAVLPSVALLPTRQSIVSNNQVPAQRLVRQPQPQQQWQQQPQQQWQQQRAVSASPVPRDGLQGTQKRHKSAAAAAAAPSTRAASGNAPATQLFTGCPTTKAPWGSRF